VIFFTPFKFRKICLNYAQTAIFDILPIVEHYES